MNCTGQGRVFRGGFGADGWRAGLTFFRCAPSGCTLMGLFSGALLNGPALDKAGPAEATVRMGLGASWVGEAVAGTSGA